MTDTVPMRALVSYWSYKNADIGALWRDLHTNGKPPDLFGDSGAFSAYTQGVRITPDEYAAWIHKWRPYFTVYANLDVIGNAKASHANLRTLEGMGLGPLPVAHTNTGTDYLKKYCAEYPYIALGGMVGKTAKALMPWCVQAFKIAKPTGTVFHGFGLTSLQPLMALPWYSVDSSSWGAGFRFGLVTLFDPKTGKRTVVRLGDRAGWAKVATQVRSYGFDPNDFADRSRNTRAKVAALSAASFFSLEQSLRRRHGLVFMQPGDRPEVRFDGGGLRIFAADGSGQNLIDGATGVARAGLRLYLVDRTGKSDLKLAYTELNQRRTT